MRNLCHVGLAVAAIGVARLALAQQAAPSVPAHEALDEIVVTAQRREENLQHAAVSVTAVTGADLSNSGVIRQEDLTQLVPSLQVAAAAGPYPLFYVRGVGNFNGNAFSDSAIAVNLDGVYIARPSSTAGMFYDLSRVEVLKGPQGTLYGRNATGGAINIITSKPTDDFSGEGSVDFGNYGAKNFGGFINVPLTSTLDARLSVNSTQHDGYFSDGTDDDRGRAARLQFKYAPSDTFTLNTSADYYHQGGKGTGATLLQAGVPGFVDGNPRIGNTSPAINAIYASTFYFPAGDTFGPLLAQSLAYKPLPANVHQGNEFWGLSATADWKTDLGTLTVVPAYRHGELNYLSTVAGFLINQQEDDRQSSLEARFASTTDHALTYLAGVYYLNEQIDGNSQYDQQYSQSTQQYELGTKSYAVFGRLAYAFTDSFRLTGGLRYTDDQKTLGGSVVGSSVVCPGAFIPPPGGPQFCFGGAGQAIVPNPPLAISPHGSFNEVTWRVGPEWDVTSTSLLYATVETGFKAGGFFFTHDDPVYQPEKITAYSIGSKNRFFDNKLQVNAEGFYWIYKNQQISHVGQDSTGSVLFPTQNVGKATIKGVELESQYLLTTSTLLMADLEFLDAKYSSYEYAVPNLGAPPTTGCPYTATPSGTFSVNCSGSTPPQSPKRSFNFGVQQTFHIRNASILADVRTHYQAATLTGLEFIPIEMQGSYWMTNATLGYHASADRWSVTGYVNNLSNKTVIQSTFPGALAGFALTAATLDPPRTYGARLSVRF